MVSERQQNGSGVHSAVVENISPSYKVEAFVSSVIARQKLEFDAPGLSATFNLRESQGVNFRSALIACDQDDEGGSRVTIWDGGVGPEGLTVTDCSRAVVLERNLKSPNVRITERLLQNPADIEVVLDSLQLIRFLGQAINDNTQYSQREISAGDFLEAYGDLLQQPLQPVWRGEVAVA